MWEGRASLRKGSKRHSRTLAKEGDGMVGATGFRGFAGLEERNDGGGFPNGRDVGLLD